MACVKRSANAGDAIARSPATNIADIKVIITHPGTSPRSRCSSCDASFRACTAKAQEKKGQVIVFAAEIDRPYFFIIFPDVCVFVLLAMCDGRTKVMG